MVCLERLYRLIGSTGNAVAWIDLRLIEPLKIYRYQYQLLLIAVSKRVNSYLGVR